MMIEFIIPAAIGFCISLYTYVVEKKIKENPTYKPVCDISDRISCSKPMNSRYANIFFFSNALLGMLYYVLIIILAVLNTSTLLFIASLCSCIVSGILGYLLYFKIKSFCLLCTSLYIINLIIFLLSLRYF